MIALRARIEAFGGDNKDWLHRKATRAGKAPKIREKG